MRNKTIAIGWILVLVAVACVAPIGRALLEARAWENMQTFLLGAACILFTIGSTGVVMGVRSENAALLPSGVRMAVIATALFAAFAALEFCDGLVRHHGRLGYWTDYLAFPAVLLLYGLLTARRWAWFAARGGLLLLAAWFVAFVVILPFAPLQTDGVPVPWYGRLYMTGFSLTFAAVLLTAFRAAGAADTRTYFKVATKSNFTA